MSHSRLDYDFTNCPLRHSLNIIGDKWTLLLLAEASYGLRRFEDFARALGCGRAVLSARLRTLTEEGFLEKRGYAEPGQRPRSEYHLTAKGGDLFTAILALFQWSERWMPATDGPVARIVDRKTGRDVTAIITSEPVPDALSIADIDIAPAFAAKRVRSNAAPHELAAKAAAGRSD